MEKEKHKETEQEIENQKESLFQYNCSFYHEMNVLWLANGASSTHASHHVFITNVPVTTAVITQAFVKLCAQLSWKQNCSDFYSSFVDFYTIWASSKKKKKKTGESKRDVLMKRKRDKETEIELKLNGETMVVEKRFWADGKDDMSGW